MEYSINIESLKELIKEEIAIAADMTFDKDGASLYDRVIYSSRDEDTLSRLIQDGIDAVVKRTADIATASSASISFNVPSMDPSNTDGVESELTRFITLLACSLWFKSRYEEKTQEYLDRATAALDKAVALLKTIKAPSR